MADITVTTVNGERFYIDNELNDGTHYPSTTTALSVWREPGLETMRGAIGNKKADRYRNEGGTTGTIIHEICELLFNGKSLGPLVLSPELEQRIDQFRTWMNENVLEVIGTEVTGINHKHHYGYTADAILELRGYRVPVLADIKSGLIAKKARMQTAAYAKPLKLQRRGLIKIPKEGEVKFIPHDNLDLDFNAFLSVLNGYNWSKRY